MKHQVRIISFSISIGETLDGPEQEIAGLLDQGYTITAATGYTTGQSGPAHGGAFVILVKPGGENRDTDLVG